MWKESLNSNGQQIYINKAITSHLNSLNTNQTSRTYDVGNPGLDFRQTQKCDGVKPVNVIPSPVW